MAAPESNMSSLEYQILAELQFNRDACKSQLYFVEILETSLQFGK